MKFFEAQKKLVKIWFVWISLLMIFVTYHVLKGKYVHVANEIMEFVKFYITPIFSLIILSNFFSRDLFDEIIKDQIYYTLALYGSVLYLFTLTFLFCYVLFKPDTNYALFMIAYKNGCLLFKFYEPIMVGVLGYFFYKNKKDKEPLLSKLAKIFRGRDNN